MNDDQMYPYDDSRITEYCNGKITILHGNEVEVIDVKKEESKQ